MCYFACVVLFKPALVYCSQISAFDSVPSSLQVMRVVRRKPSVPCRPVAVLRELGHEVNDAINYLRRKADANLWSFYHSAYDDAWLALVDNGLGNRRKQIEVGKLISGATPVIRLLGGKARGFRNNQEVYLKNFNALGVVRETHDDLGRLHVEIVATGLDVMATIDRGYTDMLEQLKRAWQNMESAAKKTSVSLFLGQTTRVVPFETPFVPHDFGTDVTDIVQSELIELLRNPQKFFHDLLDQLHANPHDIPEILSRPFLLVCGPPGCGKTFKILQIMTSCPHRIAISCHSNAMIVEVLEKIIEERAFHANLTRRLLFLGDALKGSELPPAWEAKQPGDFSPAELWEIADLENIVVIGTVKKLDDLRSRLKEFFTQHEIYTRRLRFNRVLDDEFARKAWLDFFSVCKLLDQNGTFMGFGDPKQTKAQVGYPIFINC